MQAMYALDQAKFPCLPFVSWGWMQSMDFDEHLQESSSGAMVEPTQWAIPRLVKSKIIKQTHKGWACCGLRADVGGSSNEEVWWWKSRGSLWLTPEGWRQQKEPGS